MPLMSSKCSRSSIRNPHVAAVRRRKFPGIKVECASNDATGFWQHRCPILLDGPEDQCCACEMLSNTLRVPRFQKEKRRQTTRVRLPVSPSKICKIEALQRRYKACYRAKKMLLVQKRSTGS